MKSLVVQSVVLGTFVVFTAGAGLAQSAPPPPPPNITATPAPASPAAPIPTMAPMGPDAAASATPAPPKDDPNRVGISGVWEVQIQNGAKTTYTHFKLDQKSGVLAGQYLDENGKKFPLAGSLDGKNVRIVVSLPSGGTISFSGTVDNASDMLGLLQTASATIPFTAAYRPKYKWIDNINPAAGALGGAGGGGTPH